MDVKTEKQEESLQYNTKIIIKHNNTTFMYVKAVKLRDAPKLIKLFYIFTKANLQ